MSVVLRRNAVAQARQKITSDLAAEELHRWVQKAAKRQSATTFTLVSCSLANSQKPLCTHLLFSLYHPASLSPHHCSDISFPCVDKAGGQISSCTGHKPKTH